MSAANPLSVVGLMLTLSSLLGSFFYLQLSAWVRDILALKAKSDLNKYAGTTDEKKAMRECAVEVDKLLNWPTYLVNTVVILFVVIVIVTALVMLERAAADPLYGPVRFAFYLFLAVFVVLSSVLLHHGTKQGNAVKTEVERLRADKKLDLT
ncbi:hypothetical protein [Agrobacterium sp. NPDC090283]|uniref:hypothetical protein n=1 Tax=Agrobacterium sp. NPDC090283 TaxID=3363920 RepID=UPI00383AF995